MKVAVITCYFDPNYVRARTIRAGVQAVPGVQTIIVKNMHRGILRYPEMVWKLIQLRRKQHPDVWLLTFRGQELLPLVLLLAGRKPVIFDEFIVPIAYAKGEGHARSLPTSIKHMLSRLSEPLYRLWLRQSALILADTQAHAELSARTSHVNMRQYRVLPVGADEKLFWPSNLSKSQQLARPFTIFFYGNMLPLHGLPVVLEAAEQLRGKPNIEFLIVGGNKPMRRLVEAAREHGARIVYEPWVPFEQLPAAIHAASLCLAGPFGNTPQAQHVITGKTYQFLACEAPVVVGASEATLVYFANKRNALVVTQDDAAALAKAIEWAAAHRSELVDIGRAGRNTYNKHFSHSIITAEFIKLINEVSSPSS